MKRVTEIDLLGYRQSHGSIRLDPNRLKPLMDLQPPTNSRELKQPWECLHITLGGCQSFPIVATHFLKPTVFPLARKEIETFEDLKKGLLRACLVSIIEYRQPGTQSGMRRFRGCNRCNA